MTIVPANCQEPAPKVERGNEMPAEKINAELLEALEAANRLLFLLSNEVGKMGCGSLDVIDRIKAAIRKAKGESQ